MREYKMHNNGSIPMPSRAKIPIVREVMDLKIEYNTTWEQLEEIAGISRVTMQQYNSGRLQPSIGMLQAIANSFGYELVLRKIK